MVPGRCLSAVAATFLKGIVIAMAINWTPWVSAGEIALQTSMAMGFAMCPAARIPKPAIMTLWPTQMMAVVNSRPITTTVQGIVSMTAMATAFAMSWK